MNTIVEKKNVMTTETKFEKSRDNYERAIKQIRENLEYLSGEGKVSQKFLTMQNLYLKSITEFQANNEAYISHLELENIQLSRKLFYEYQRLRSNTEALEAICIIHGIIDFPAWLAKGKNLLVATAVDHYHQDTVQLPYSLIELLNQLSKEDRETVFDLLYKRHDAKINSLKDNLFKEMEKQDA